MALTNLAGADQCADQRGSTTSQEADPGGGRQRFLPALFPASPCSPLLSPLHTESAQTRCFSFLARLQLWLSSLPYLQEFMPSVRSRGLAATSIAQVEAAFTLRVLRIKSRASISLLGLCRACNVSTRHRRCGPQCPIRGAG
jgi:hypothetical protein